MQLNYMVRMANKINQKYLFDPQVQKSLPSLACGVFNK